MINQNSIGGVLYVCAIHNDFGLNRGCTIMTLCVYFGLLFIFTVFNRLSLTEPKRWIKIVLVNEI